MQTVVYCTFSQVGFHNWPEAPDKYRDLRTRHRHNFQFKVGFVVGHGNREIEFIDMKEKCRDLITTHHASISDYGRHNHVEFNHMSCEMIADWLIKKLQEKEYAVTFCEVSEDGENGAIVYVQ